MRAWARIAAVCGLWASLGCEKVPITDIHAGFALAEATWFAEEETLFFFYRANAEQGLGPDSQIELSYRTDDEQLDWTPVSQLAPVHSHVAVDCGPKMRCGSTSLPVRKVPRQVGLRLRYHRDGEVTLPAPTVFFVVGPGPAHTHRSLLVYGVFDEANARIQWRARHQFPTLRNEEVQALGLRRSFRVDLPAYGTLPRPAGNPYGYGFSPACPAGLTPLGFEPSETNERAVFGAQQLPLDASRATHVCARATVTDAKGTFQTSAVALKNPQVRPAFASLRSPVKPNTVVGFLLHPCQRTISEPHRKMQVQRLLLEGAPELCLDDWRTRNFASTLAARLRARIDEVRAEGKDMVLVLALHHDDTTKQLAGVVEEALELLLPTERDKSSPRVSGAFVFDSMAHGLSRPQLGHLALWCPASIAGDDLDGIPTTAQRTCPLLPDQPDLKLGPFRLGNLPVLPTRAQYLTFIEKYSEAQAGRSKALTFLAPERTPLSENVRAGDFGVATFFNNEVLTPAPTDAFSYCATDDRRADAVVFRIAPLPEPLPLRTLPQVHQLAPQPAYGLGLFWEFPFLTRLEYEVVLAGAATAFSLTVPFGISNPAEAFYGSDLWKTGEFPLAEHLLQCTQFCDHPTFDSAGVYNARSSFKGDYREQCYRPKYPSPEEGGFPLDP